MSTNKQLEVLAKLGLDIMDEEPQLTLHSIKQHASTLGYDFSDEDCHYIINTSYTGESVEHAVDDFLRAFEG